MSLRKITTLAMLLALAIVLHMLESMMPLLSNLMLGIKLGLANIVILITLYLFTYKEATFISIGRVFLVGLLRTGLFGISFFFSLAGALASITIMSLAKRYTKLSVVGVSTLGSLFHSLGQILIALIILKTKSVLFYLPYLFLCSIPTGIIIGLTAKQVLSFYGLE